ncbi:hypothetical protein BT93_H1094 [Corymbia citriodora subsp. variegata]|nr:hypothetical protein BT93_H1094 [Corymbia citriodora subsp. variegata]
MANFIPFIAMLIVQLGFAGMNITSKLALDSGMSPLVLVTYRQVFAAAATGPLALLRERKTRPKITWPILVHIFACSITGKAFMNQVFFFVGLKKSTPTIAVALSNLLPAMTFFFVVIFRQESIAIKSNAGKAKVMGTLICVGGAMLLGFYHEPDINIGHLGFNWMYATKLTAQNSTANGNVLGPVLLFVSTAAWAVWFILQAKLNAKFLAPYTTTALVSLMASVECAVVGIAVEHHLTAWSLRSTIWLVSALYVGCICSAMAFCITSWCIEKKGPLYTAVFTPLLSCIGKR